MRGGLGETTPGGGFGGGAGMERKCCLPVTLKQVMTAEEEGDSAFLIDQKSISMVCRHTPCACVPDSLC